MDEQLLDIIEGINPELAETIRNGETIEEDPINISVIVDGVSYPIFK